MNKSSVVGILAPRRSGLAKPYQAQTSLFRRMLKAGEELDILVYVFDFHQIRWQQKQVVGYVLRDGKWRSRLFRLPDVVFDRSTGVFPGGRYGVDRARQRLNKLGIKIFNTRLGSKMRMHRLMQADEVLKKHLPITSPLRTDVATRLVARYGGVYMKPQHGAQGKGIIRLQKTKKGVSFTATRRDYQQIKGQAATVAGAISYLRQRMSLANYLVQPDLQLLRYRGRICDVRVLVQKDEAGLWQVTGAAVRAGAAGRVVSNLHGGGRSLRLEQLLENAFAAEPEKQELLREQVGPLALRVAAVLERSTACLGELGVDLGIDKKGRLWVIEANSRTGRAVFRRCGMHEAARLADRRPLLYAQYLAGKRWDCS